MCTRPTAQHTFESCMGGIWLPEGQELYRYMPWNAPASYTGYLTELETRRQKAAWQTFAIFDKTRPEGLNMAGTVSYTKSTEADLSLELGAVYIFPDFQVRRLRCAFLFRRGRSLHAVSS